MSKCCCLPFLSLWLATPLLAQIPEGWSVAAETFSLTGLWAVPARGGSPPVPLTGLPPELVLTINVSRGANAVAIHPDGRVFAGNNGSQTGSAIAVHALRLNGLAVASSRRVQVGTSTSTTGAVTALAILPDGRCLVTANGLQAGSPMTRLAIVDIDAGSLTPLPITGAPSTNYNALTLNQAGTIAYFGTWVSTTSGQIWRVGVPAGGAATLVATLPHGITGLDVAADGRLVVVMNNATGGNSLGNVDPGTGAFTVIPGNGTHGAAVAVERASGALIVAGSTNTTQEVRLVENGVFTPLFTAFPGTLSGVDVQDSPRRYGVGTPLANTYAWHVAPNAGGVPFLGNATFALEVRATPGVPLASVGLFSTGRSLVSTLGVTILVEPSALITVGVPAAASASIPIPIPASPSLFGAVLHGQTLHVEAGGFAASDGVTFGLVMP
ncbi:MAG: hypothetical protein IPK26_09495 [Planctomycetes bacterium]|nr:hypothetical protein [Planctomycetota bacterium]